MALNASAGEFDTALSKLIAKADAQALKRVGFETANQVLRQFPRKYLIPGKVTRIAELVQDEQAIVYGTVRKVSVRPMRQRKGSLVAVTIADNEGSTVEATFFNQPWLEKTLPEGRTVIVTGTVSQFRDKRQLANPTWLNPAGGEEFSEEELEKPLPIYPAQKGVASARFGRIVRELLAGNKSGSDRGESTGTANYLADIVPDQVRARHGLPCLKEAYELVHTPEDEADVDAAHAYFTFEEAFALQVELFSRRKRWSEELANPLPGAVGGLLDQFDAGLPFELTQSQRSAGAEISRDLSRAAPMNRLLHGDVGSGKTLVALRAMLQAVDSGKQAALLAPTEILAAQHFQSIVSALGELITDGSMMTRTDGVRCALLTGSLSQKERKTLLTDLVIGNIDIVVGTHALVSETTMFYDLGLIIIDEQHRFGVKQREALRAKGGGQMPHTLVMTATPIPRTVAMTVFGDLDTSTLTELPGGPKHITTHTVSLADHPQWLARVWAVLKEHVAAGHQAFVVSSRIDTEELELDKVDMGIQPLLGVEDLAQRLRDWPDLDGVRIETLHGRSDPEVKETAMTRFAHHEFDVLVATTVIEVGVDIPAARLIVIYDADRFGVAQLHQLRGRVGRDGSPALCFFVTTQPGGSDAVARLHTVANTLDGFKLSAYDVETRREGDVLGKSQWGAGSSLRYVSVIHDEAVIERARADAIALVDTDPQWNDPGSAEHAALQAYLADIMSEDESYLETS